MNLHSTQSIVAKNNHDYRVVCCGRQWGKSTLAVLEMISMAYSKSGREIAYFATTYDQARNIAWTILKDFSRSVWSKPPNESRLELYLKTQDKGESRLTLRGFENVETARGQQFDLLVLDEVAQMKHWDYAWQAILEPTLAFRKGKALFLSTPLGKNHFFEMFERGQRGDENWKSWKFTSYENPFLPAERIDKAKEQSTEDYFQQEYLASFTSAVGLAHKNWDRDKSLLQTFEVPFQWQRGRGFDYGSSHPTASIRIAIDNEDNWFVERCYNQQAKTIKDHADVIKSQDFGLGFVPAWGDPSGAQWFMEFQQHDINIQPANKEIGQNARGWVEYCIEKVNERLKPRVGHKVKLPDGTVIDDAPSLFILDTEENKALIIQMENLKWKENRSTGETMPMLDESDDPTGGHYDLLAALRYFTVSFTPQSKTDRDIYGQNYEYVNSSPKPTFEKKWRIGGGYRP